MADPKYVRLLQSGAGAWNEWRRCNPDTSPDFYDIRAGAYDLAGVDLSRIYLKDASFLHGRLARSRFVGADLRGADLRFANLAGADMRGANLWEADLGNASLAEADLMGANLLGASLDDADLTRAHLHYANLTQATLRRVNLEAAILSGTILVHANLTGARNAELCVHAGPSHVDASTIVGSGGLPVSFLRGCGLEERRIQHPLEGPYYSCFISHASPDKEFATKLHDELQVRGVRCWFAPYDMPIGGMIRDTIDAAVMSHERLLLVLSTASIRSQWVQQEVEKGLERERQDPSAPVVFPVRIDDSVLGIKKGWPSYLRTTRHIGDFSDWRSEQEFRKTLTRLLRDLSLPASAPGRRDTHS